MLLQKFREYAQQQHLFPPGQKVLLAVSGGRDSVAMLHLCHRAGIPFAVAHCNFNLRPGDCQRDLNFVEQLAQSLQVPFYITDFDTERYARQHSLGIEEAARLLRYDWFAHICRSQGLACVAVAHHRDDSVETLFLNLFRGTGIAGLHGILPHANIAGVDVVRPMLPFTRDDINRYVDQHRLEYVEDVTNGSLDANRNWIRNDLLPRVRERYPSIGHTVADSIDRFAEVEQVYNNYIALARNALVRPLPRRVPTLPQPTQGIRLEAVPEPRATLLFELLRPYGANAAIVDEILGGHLRTGACFSTPSHDLVLDRGTLVLGPRVAPVEPRLSYAEEHLSNGKPGIFVDADTLVQPLSLRLWQPGDVIVPLGFDHRRKVSDVLKDLKLSSYDKRYVWMLLDAEGRIVWIVGLLQSQLFRVTHRTTRVLHICLESTEETTTGAL